MLVKKALCGPRVTVMRPLYFRGRDPVALEAGQPQPSRVKEADCAGGALAWEPETCILVIALLISLPVPSPKFSFLLC